MEDGKLIKLEKDFSAEVDSLVQQTNSLAESNQTQKAFDLLLQLEKQTRVGADAVSNGRVLVQIVSLAYKSKDLKLVNEYVTILSKKHGLLNYRQAVTRMVQEAVTYIDQIKDMAQKLELIDTLRMVTDGKIYVEVERARVTRILAKIKEDEGKIVEAANTLQELQVETFGSMERREKTDFILEQMRLCLAKKDYTRVQIISRKINTKYFIPEENQDLKLRYYEILIQHALFEDSYLDVCKYYQQIYETPVIKADDSKKIAALQNVVAFICLSPFDNEQSDFINRLSLDSNLNKIPLFKQLVKSFITNELMRWPKIEEIYGTTLKALPIFNVLSEDGAKRWKALHSRVTEHNIRVIAKYYTRISMKRLENLLDLTAADAEEFLSKLVVSKTIYARIDRPKGVVSFIVPKNAQSILNEWSADVNSLLSIIERTNHLIAKEEMVHSIIV